MALSEQPPSLGRSDTEDITLWYFHITYETWQTHFQWQMTSIVSETFDSFLKADWQRGFLFNALRNMGATVYVNEICKCSGAEDGMRKLHVPQHLEVL